MIHGCVSYCDCVTCQWVATRQGITTSSEEDILYLCICLYLELIWKLKRDNWHPSLTHITPLCTWASTHTVRCKVLWSCRHHSHVKHTLRHICSKPKRKEITDTSESALLIILPAFCQAAETFLRLEWPSHPLFLLTSPEILIPSYMDFRNYMTWFNGVS